MSKLNNGNLKIAIQREGRLSEPSLSLLKDIGLDFESYQRKLFSRCQNFSLDILFIRDDDIPAYVKNGVMDLGIVGQNIIYEKNVKVEILAKLGFGKCSLVIAIPKKSRVKKLDDLNQKKIATAYPISLKKFLAKKGIQAEIINLKGSVEVAPSLDIADAICDLSSSGSTLRVNELIPLVKIFDSEAVLIANQKTLKGPKRKNIERLKIRIQGLLQARRTKYVMLNAPVEALSKIKEIIPGLKAPTVVPLAEKGMIAVHSVVPEEIFWEVVEKLKMVGASGILVSPIEKIIL